MGDKLSSANEDYLEAICELYAKGSGGVRSVDIAGRLEVSKASVNKAVGMLKTAGYVEQEPYGDIMLTDAGRRYGEAVLERHRTLRSFLVDDLGVDEATAEVEACAMEHTIGDDTMRKWVAYLKSVDSDETRQK